VAKPKGKAQISEPITLPYATGSEKTNKISKVGGEPKPKEQGTWVRYTQVTKTTSQVPDVHLAEVKRDPSHASDPRPSKRQNVSQHEVLCQVPAAVADV